jgi:hypothetical protein
MTYPAIARLFRKGVHDTLEHLLLGKVQPEMLARLQTRADYEKWVEDTVEDPCWAVVSRWPCESIRWAHIAKVLNILAYEVLANRELTAEADWQRLQSWLHVPVDRLVMRHLKGIDTRFNMRSVLKGMTKVEYQQIQAAIQKLALEQGVPPIWFEAAWTAENARPKRKGIV